MYVFSYMYLFIFILIVRDAEGEHAWSPRWHDCNSELLEMAMALWGSVPHMHTHTLKQWQFAIEAMALCHWIARNGHGSVWLFATHAHTYFQEAMALCHWIARNGHGSVWFFATHTHTLKQWHFAIEVLEMGMALWGSLPHILWSNGTLPLNC